MSRIIKISQNNKNSYSISALLMAAMSSSV